MKKYCMICFRGCLNGKRTFIDLLVIQLNQERKSSPVMFVYDLINYLYQQRGKGELGPKNGYKTAGWLDVLMINSVPEAYESKVIEIASSDMNEVYKMIKDPLKKVIAEKIKIKKKGE